MSAKLSIFLLPLGAAMSLGAVIVPVGTYASELISEYSALTPLAAVSSVNTLEPTASGASAIVVTNVFHTSDGVVSSSLLTTVVPTSVPISTPAISSIVASSSLVASSSPVASSSLVATTANSTSASPANSAAANLASLLSNPWANWLINPIINPAANPILDPLANTAINPLADPTVASSAIAAVLSSAQAVENSVADIVLPTLTLNTTSLSVSVPLSTSVIPTATALASAAKREAGANKVEAQPPLAMTPAPLRRQLAGLNLLPLSLVPTVVDGVTSSIAVLPGSAASALSAVASSADLSSLVPSLESMATSLGLSNDDLSTLLGSVESLGSQSLPTALEGLLEQGETQIAQLLMDILAVVAPTLYNSLAGAVSSIL